MNKDLLVDVILSSHVPLQELMLRTYCFQDDSATVVTVIHGLDHEMTKGDVGVTVEPG